MYYMSKKIIHEVDRLYNTQKWQRTKKEVIARDAGRCQICNRLIKGRFIIHHKSIATIENFYNIDNLELLDIRCHNAITFGSGVKRPYDELHEASIEINNNLIDL